MKKTLIVLFLIIAVGSCKYTKSNKGEQLGVIKFDTIKSEYIYSWNPNLDSINPFQFLESIKTIYGANREIIVGPFIEDSKQSPKTYQITKVPQNWIKLQYIDSLMNLINDTTSTIPVFSAFANMMPVHDKHTTVGIEAMRMIQGYKNNIYPSLWPEFYANDTISSEFKMTKRDLLIWWNINK